MRINWTPYIQRQFKPNFSTRIGGKMACSGSMPMAAMIVTKRARLAAGASSLAGTCHMFETVKKVAAA